MNTIPLHLLPDEAYLSVLRNMGICAQLAYSLCSKNTKKAIKSLKLKAEQIHFYVCALTKVEINFGNSIQFASYILRDNNFPNNLIVARKEIRVQGNPFGNQVQWSWNFKNLELEEWVHHFCEVLHHPRIDELVFSGRSIDDNDIEPVQKVIKGFQLVSLVLYDNLTNDFARKALESFPNYENLFLDLIPIDSHKLKKLLVQNLKLLSIGEAERLKINQVLFTNSERIQLKDSRFTEKDFNQLLKLWIRGSNPRLKHFYTWGQPQLGGHSFNKNAILKGINYVQIPLDCQEVYREYVTENNHHNGTKLAGGYRVWSFSGTTAVIVGRPFGNQVQWSWNFRNFELEEWVHHFCEVLHHPRIDKFSFSGGNSDENYLEAAQKIIKGLQLGSLSLSGDLTNYFVKKVLESLPNYVRLFLDLIPFFSNKLNMLLVQNLKSVGFSYAEQIGIDQLLLTNSERIQLNESTFTENDNEHVPLDSQEVYKDYTSVHFRNVPLAGGFRIWRSNGTTAVILVTRRLFQFIVE
ncbi:unnamed protein product [Caenorhabditis brenneri]